MPRKGTPSNWKATEHATYLVTTVKNMQTRLLNGESVGQFKEDFLSNVVELAIALQWEEDLMSDLKGGHIVTTPPVVKATIVEQPKTGFTSRLLGGTK